MDFLYAIMTMFLTVAGYFRGLRVLITNLVHRQKKIVLSSTRLVICAINIGEISTNSTIKICILISYFSYFLLL